MYVVSSINLSTTQITKVAQAAVKNTCTGKTTGRYLMSKHFTVAIALRAKRKYTEKLPKSRQSISWLVQISIMNRKKQTNKI